ncbi:organelle RRM domain-containing protein 1, chloroplastic [Pistacia vera]|uniref:organelle RRM domain-containing protein 1, chloroplastic n=1 Tax=Pistacia vera TaxID=55513 RepID=UPI0012632652|nr:organelle RRM domain-containing protein 1, chloroplastic [Pistacia vera]
MEALSLSATTSSITISLNLPIKPCKTHIQTAFTSLNFSTSHGNKTRSTHSFFSSPFNSKSAGKTSLNLSSSTTATTPFTSNSLSSTETDRRHWMVLMERPSEGLKTKPEIVNYYVKTLERVLGSETDAQMCIYDASCDTHFGFCCDINEETSRLLARLPGVLSVRPDPDYNSMEKDYSCSNSQLSNLPNSQIGTTLLFPARNTKRWLVRMDKPGVGVVTKPQMVDFYAHILTKVLGNEKDAQMCIYHVSWQSNFGFCCELDEECAKELAGVPGVLSVQPQPDENFGSENKDYVGTNLQNSVVPTDSEGNQTNSIETKKLFVTGLSFYTSEKTLRAAFEGFGELVEVKIIMDKISKRSKGYAFVEYTTEKAASAALKEMNGKIINGWMIVVDVAKPTPARYGQNRPRQAG